MTRLEPGMIIATSYETGPYRILDIQRGCTCPEYVSSLEGDDAPSQEHIHLTLEHIQQKPGKRNRYWLNGYDEETLKCVWNTNRIIIVHGGPVQRTIF